MICANDGPTLSTSTLQAAAASAANVRNGSLADIGYAHIHLCQEPGTDNAARLSRMATLLR